MSTVATSRSPNNETMGLRKNVAALTFLRKVTVRKLRSQHIKKAIVSFFSQKRIQLLPKTIAFKSCWLYTAQCNLARYMFSILLKNGIQISYHLQGELFQGTLWSLKPVSSNTNFRKRNETSTTACRH